jgi:ABC-type microcin C transport system permease subunit YejB
MTWKKGYKIYKGLISFVLGLFLGVFFDCGAYWHYFSKPFLGVMLSCITLNAIERNIK